MALQQDTKKTAVLAFGRMNPPTTGHEAMIQKTHAVAKQHGGTAHVVASHTQDKNKNPLPQDKKLEYIKKIAHPDVNVSGSSKEHPSIMHHASKLHAAGHTHLVVVSDKTKEFHTALHKYNGKKGPHGHYNFKSISVVDSGKRDSKSDGVTGVSGTKMRHYSRTGQHDKFKQGLPKALHPHAKDIHGHIGGTQLESFKEALLNKKFKLGSKKTEIIVHTNPTADPKGKGFFQNGKGSPANNAGAMGARFGEGRHMKMMNAEFENFIGQELEEVLSRQSRIKRALVLRRFKHKIQRRKKILRGKLATKEVLHRRARRHAVKLVRKRFMGKKGEQYNKLGMADKILIDKKIATKRTIIDRIAQRLLPKVRRSELIRLRDMKKKKAAPKKSTVATNVVKQSSGWSKPSKPSTPWASTTSAGNMASHVKSESIVTEDNIFDVVDSFELLTEKDMNAIEKKCAKTDIDPNILFEVFLMGLEDEGDQTSQQKGFQSLNTFIARVDQQCNEAIADWDDEPVQGVQLDRRYDRPIIKRSTIPSLKEFKATGENAYVADPVDPKKIDWKDSHTLAAYKMGKGSSKGKKNPFHKKNDPEGQLHTCWNMGCRGDSIPEALSYPHETAKQYKKDTPGQNEENCGCGQDPCITYGKKAGIKELDTSTLQSYQAKASDARNHRKLSTKKVDNRYAGVKKASDRLDKRNKAHTGGTQLEDVVAVQKATAQNKLEKLRLKDRHTHEKERLTTSHKNEVERLRTNEAYEEFLKLK